MREQPDFSTHPSPRRPPVWKAGLIIAGVLALGLAGRASWLERRAVSAAREQVAGARRQLASLQSRLGATAERPAAEVELLSRASAAIESPPERVVARLAAALPSDVRLDRLRIEYGDVISLEMQVVARDASSWDLFLARLVEDGSFESVTPGSERRDGEIRSAVTARWAGGAR